MKMNRILLNLLILVGGLLIVFSVFQNDYILTCIELIVGLFLFTYNLCILCINITVEHLLELFLMPKPKMK